MTKPETHKSINQKYTNNKLEDLKNQLTVVLPTLNEEKAIGTVIEELKSEGYTNILVVDGYSQDNTVKIALEKGAKVIYQIGKGKTGAIKTAIDNIETPYLLIMDADYTYDPKDIHKMLLHIPKYDEIIGYRTKRENIPLLHRLGNYIISLAFSILHGQRVLDPCSGMYILKTETAKNIELNTTGFDVEVEIASQIANYGKIAEVPINYRKRIGEKKLETWKTGTTILLTIFKMAMLYNPIFLFTALASLLTIPGLAILLWQLYLRYIRGGWSLGWAWAGLVMLIIGIQAFTITLIIILLKRLEKRILQTINK